MVSSTHIISASNFFAQNRAIIAQALRYWTPGDRASTTSNTKVAITGNISSLEINVLRQWKKRKEMANGDLLHEIYYIQCREFHAREQQDW